MLVDTHAHIYMYDFDNDRAQVVSNALKNDVVYILMPAIDKNDYHQVLQTAKEYPHVCLPMMGLYPDSVNEYWKNDLQIVYQYLTEKPFIAVGEIGLDFLTTDQYKQAQIEVFDLQLQYALHFNLPVSVHSRNSMDNLISIIKKNQNGNLRGVQHCFSGTLEDAKQLIDLGFYLGIGGRVTRKNAGILEILQSIGIEHIVLETDAPYVVPKQYAGKRNEPAYLVSIVDFLSEHLHIAKDNIATITTNNAHRIFNIQNYLTKI